MRELRLIFALAQNGSFIVRIEDRPGHTVGVPATLTPFLDEDDYENLRWYRGKKLPSASFPRSRLPGASLPKELRDILEEIAEAIRSQ